MSNHDKHKWEAGTVEHEEMTFTGPYVKVSARSALMMWDGLVAIVGGSNAEQAQANAHLIAAAPDLLAELQSALEDMESEPVQCVGDWERSLFCGLEDRNITDRYEACRHGYEAALEKVQEWVLCSFEDIIKKAGE